MMDAACSVLGVLAVLALAWALCLGPLADPNPTCSYLYKVGVTPCETHPNR